MPPNQSGRREGCPSRLPHHRTCGSAYGGSWQSLRIEQPLFLCHGDRCPEAQPVGFNAPGQDPRWSCLPAKFSPSRVVSPSGLSSFRSLSGWGSEWTDRELTGLSWPSETADGHPPRASPVLVSFRWLAASFFGATGVSSEAKTKRS